MRKYLILLVFALMEVQAWAGEVTLTVGELIWGSGNELVISMTNEMPVNGFQLDLILPAGFVIKNSETGADEPLPTERLKGLSLFCKAFPGNRYRIVAFSMQGNLIRGNEGTILRVPLEAVEEVTQGRYEVSVTNASASIQVDGKSEAAKIDNLKTIIEVKTSRM